MFYLKFNNKNNKDLNFSIIKRPSIPCPQKKYNKITIDGSDGDSYEDTGTYEDIEINISCNFTTNDFNKTWRRIKYWVNNIDDYKLTFSDDIEYFYKVKKVEIKENERVIKKIGKFTLVFICDPYSYLKNGEEERILTGELENYYSICKPIYIVNGTGKCILNINGNECILNVLEEINIDTDTGKIYDSSGHECPANTKIDDFEYMYLISGTNHFNWSENFNITLIPNWRII